MYYKNRKWTNMRIYMCDNTHTHNRIYASYHIFNI